MKNALTIASVFIFIQFGYSQFPNFEFLDHTDYQTTLRSYEVNNGEIIYTENNLHQWGFSSQVKLIREGETPIILFDSDSLYNGSFKTISKIYYNSQGLLRLYLYGLSNVSNNDFTSADYVVIGEQEDGSYAVNIIDNPAVCCLESIVSLSIDSLDNVYTYSAASRFQKFSNDTLEKEVYLDEAYRIELHTNVIGQVYAISKADSIIYKVDDMDLIEVNKLSGYITESKVINEENWILTYDKNISIYNTDFSALIRQIDFPFDINTLDQVDEYNSKVYVIQQLDDGIKVHNYNSGTLTDFYEVEEQFASSSKLRMLSDSTFLSAGQYEIEDITDNLFFRRYSISEDFIPERKYVDLDYFNLKYLKDTLITGAPDLFVYGVDYSFQNGSFADITLTSIYTSNILAGTGLFIIYADNRMELVQPVESVIIDTTKLLPFEHPQSDVRVVVQGSDYRFNIWAEPIDANVTTGINNENENDQLVISPNPFSNSISISSAELVSHIDIYDIMGQLVRSISDIDNLILGDLENGIYFLKAKIGSKWHAIKVVKVNSQL